MITTTTCAGRPAWRLQTNQSAMLLSVTPTGALLLDHWGAIGDEHLPNTPANRPSQAHFLDGIPLAYSVHGDPAYKEPGLLVASDSSITRLSFVDDMIADRVLTLRFNDAVTGLTVEHRFTIHDTVIVRDVLARNDGPTALRIEQIASATLGLPPQLYTAWTLHGRWGGEYQLTQRELGPGKLVLESRRGFTSHEANPWFAITSDEHTWFGALAWSGNWSIVLETERNDALHVVAGIQPFDFAWDLAPGESFRTPALVCGYTAAGLDDAARVLHRYQNEQVLRDLPRPVHYNTWLATGLDVEETRLVTLAKQAADLGVEVFVVDDGWFANRVTDNAGLGDWVVDNRKFPQGLGPLIDEVQRLGMGFGIWVEPEMVNPDSDLYRAHPDWVLHVPDREPTLSRDQLVLNFALPEARHGVLTQLRRLLTDHRIDFLKWDHNRPYTEVGWREAWVRHVRGVYEVLGKLRTEFPHVLIETCAGGGGRVDLGMLGLTDLAQVSDNTDPADRLRTQYGYTRAYAPRTMVGWVSDNPEPTTGRDTPLEFRFHVAMQGVLGVSGDLAEWSTQDRSRARELIAEYKRLRPTIQGGDQYWLVPPSGTEPCAVQYVSPDRGETVVFCYQVRGLAGEGPRRVRLRGLAADRRYRRTGDGAVSTGAALMGAGVPVVFPPLPPPRHTADWRSVLEVWEAI